MVIRVGRGGGGRGGVSMEIDKFRKKRKMKRNEFRNEESFISSERLFRIVSL